jgi:hypothetical protein
MEVRKPFVSAGVTNSVHPHRYWRRKKERVARRRVRGSQLKQRR